MPSLSVSFFSAQRRKKHTKHAFFLWRDPVPFQPPAQMLAGPQRQGEPQAAARRTGGAFVPGPGRITGTVRLRAAHAARENIQISGNAPAVADLQHFRRQTQINAAIFRIATSIVQQILEHNGRQFLLAHGLDAVRHIREKQRRTTVHRQGRGTPLAPAFFRPVRLRPGARHCSD